MKKAVSIILIVCLLVGIVATFAGCNKTYSDLHVLYLGDSIAEAIAGPAPIEERGDYGYFGIVGQINDYYYDNRAISGNQTIELLQYINRKQEDGYVTRKLIKEADVICISITGNDLLWHNFPLMLYELAAREKYGDDYVNRPEVAACYEYHRYDTFTQSDGTVRDQAPGDGITTFENCIATATRNVDDIVAALRALNANATIFFQNVYNPVDDESEIIPDDLVKDMMVLDAKYDFSTEAGVAEFRRWGGYMLGRLSDILENVAKNNKGVEFLDVAKAFDDIYQSDRRRGKDLIFVDGVHPSDQGHAVIAATMQDKLVKLGLAEKKQSLARYKALRKQQLERMYTGVEGVDVAAAEKAIDKAKNMDAVSVAYFKAVEGFTPKLSTDPVQGKTTNGVAVQSKETYPLTRVISRRADEEGQAAIDGVLDAADLVVTQKDLTFNTDGTMELVIKTLPVASLLPMLSAAGVSLEGMVLGGIEDTRYKNEDGSLIGLKLSGAQDAFSTLHAYADAIFPGIGFTSGNFGANAHLLYDSLGVTIEGLDPLFKEPYTDTVGLPVNMAPEGTIDQSTIGRTYNSYADYLIAYLGRYQEVVDADGKTLHVDKLPDGITDELKKLDVITIRLKTVYSLVTVTGADGTPIQAAYCGSYRDKTSPWMIVTKYVDEYDEVHYSMNFEVLGFVIQF